MRIGEGLERYTPGVWHTPANLTHRAATWNLLLSDTGVRGTPVLLATSSSADLPESLDLRLTPTGIIVIRKLRCSSAAHLEDLDVHDATFGCPDLTTFCRLDELGRTLSKRAADVLAYYDRPGTSNGPTEAINLVKSRSSWGSAKDPTETGNQ